LIGSFYVNEARWRGLPEDLQMIVRRCIEAGHHFRKQWYWCGEARLRATGDQLELTTVPPAEWAEVEQAAVAFWDEMAQQSERSARVIQIFKDYNAATGKAGLPYTCL